MFSTQAVRYSPPSSSSAAIMTDQQDSTESNETPQDKVTKRFDQLEAIHPYTQKAIARVFKYEEMSVVQDAVLSRLPNGNDMFVKAKTGTGKTLAFLIAALETALDGKSRKDLQNCDGTSILVISPTRELAYQIAEEAKKLTRFFPFGVHCLVGGDSKRRQIHNLERGRCDIVVATPGRLNDMLSSVRHLKNACENLKVLVLDEADQLLDMGFKQELKQILAQLPDERQTMLFSATISKDIRKNLGDFALSSQHDLIDTVGKDEVNTHLHVKQSALVTPYQGQLQLLQHLLSNYEAANAGKVIVFLPTTKQTMVYAQLFKYLLPNRVVHEIHSRKSQDQRSRIANKFRNSKGGILFTSDVSARGVDYPGVSLVVQVGIPSTREQYIHRLGRTGRAGREGEGIIVVAPFEKEFLKKDIGDLPIQKLEPPALDEKQVTVNERAIDYALKSLDDEMIREVYTGYLGYYSSRMPQLGKYRAEALDEAKLFLEGIGITDIPHLSQRFLQQLGLDDRAPRSPFTDRRKRFGDQRNRFDDRRNRFDDQRNRFGDRRSNDRFDDRRRPDRFDDRRNDRFNDRRNDRFGDRRQREDSFGDRRYRSSNKKDNDDFF
ncbi:P-loop containing nucleoside triphosphate hydrolase protein [Halteromyces radiatus]|uniref:P-loop containing nucleoside triphosphate hydrolase protein n=1 Tax=Halteromyces radiatus TaxID=101107 RepID=UPI00221FA4AC|nr:P-loop containing nucleoside triphosphate hydrolase protein [Halteromyces radiatus]KAI8081641.1 P-loop containing nucleoside triphosphate hydrolase protein [Halteromyces radiatus]